MSIYKNKEELHQIFTGLWEKIFNTPDIAGPLSREKLTVRFRYSDYKTDLYLSVGGGKNRIFWDPETEVKIDVDMILSSDIGHKFWMEDLNVPLAIGTRKIIAKGSIQKALKLIPALKPAFPLYPDILREFGRSDLLAVKKIRKPKKRSFRPFGRRRKGLPNMEAIPGFFMSADEKPRESIPKIGEKPEPDSVSLFKTMCSIRAFEEHLSKGFRIGEIPTEAIHLSIGQEAIAAGVCLNLRDTDYINTTHRGHGHIIAKGANLNSMMAEIYGKAEGLCEGKGGSIHVTDGSLGVLGANGIVGAGYLLAMGAGLTIKYEKRDDISVVFAGDGSVNQGMFHEALNMIGVFGLPVLVIVENNLYGEFTPVERHSAQAELFRRMQVYNIESQRIDGNDATLVSREIRKIIDQMRKDGKPRAVEFTTYRWHGHMEGEPELYRSREEKESYIKKDPIQKLETELLSAGKVESDELEKIRTEANRLVEEAADFARRAALPPDSALTTRIYHPADRSLMEGKIPPAPGGSEISYSQAINRALEEEMGRDEKVFLWGEDVTLGGYFNVTDGLVEKFGNARIMDTPISENGIIGGAVGAAMTGLRPVCEILFSDFLTCCMDPILNQAAKLRYMTGGQVSVPLTIRTPVGSGIGMAAQHSQSMERFFFGIPGLMVVAPSDPFTAHGLLKSAIRSNNPVLFFEHKLLYPTTGPVGDDDVALPLGKARIVRTGTDVTIVTHLLGVSVALEAAENLSQSGIEAEVIDLVTLYPMDTETILESVAGTARLVTLEEGTCTGGIGAEVIARVTSAGFHLLKAPPLRIAAPECPIPYAKNLETQMMLDPNTTARRINDLIDG